MIDQAVLQEALADYKEAFVEETWPDEKYKWQAVQHFQDNWQPDAEDFPAMLKRSLGKTENLLGSAGSFPRSMILEFAESDPERVRAMFAALFDESMEVFERIEAFKAASKELLEANGARSDYQTENSISTYLWLRYPDKYYIYKWSEARAVSDKLDAGYPFTQGRYADNIRDYLQMYGELADAAKDDPDLRSLLDSQLTEDCYADPQLRTLAIDLAYYISRTFQEGGAGEQDEELVWRPSVDEYDPGLEKEDWLRLLADPEVFDKGNLEVMKRMKHAGGSASCKALSSEYGRSPQFYIGSSAALAKRVVKESGCPQPPDRWWPILYTGRGARDDEEGDFVWRLRDELSEALDEVDLSGVELYAVGTDGEQRGERGYWWLVASPRQPFRFNNLEVGGVEPWTLLNESGHKRQIYQNFLDARKGDLVLGYESSPVKQVVALGKIAQEQDGENLWFEKTEGLVTPVDLAEIQADPTLADMEPLRTNVRGSLFKMTEEEYDAALDLIRDSNPAPSTATTTEPPAYNKQDFLDEVYMSEEDYDQLVNVLRRKKNMILQGAPGVGKTFAADRLAWSMMGRQDQERIQFVQFHQNYSYEDFVEGYKPAGEGFSLKPGIFQQFCKKAANSPDQEHFFIIDEINRGNMSKIFGELLMLVEDGYRGKKATLAYSGDSFSVPPNVHVIGMMNTADRSLAMIDYALRRRFSFVSMEPGFDTEGFRKYQEARQSPTLDRLINLVKQLNGEIAADPSLGSGFRVGHSYFCNQKSVTEEWLRAVIDYDLVPMLEEYWFDDERKVKEWRPPSRRARAMSNSQQIIVKNVYYMLAYAFQTLDAREYEQLGSEEFDHLHDLFAAILAKGVSRQLKQGLHREYVVHTEELGTVRGKIDLPVTIQLRVARKRRLSCRFDVLSENNLLNQILKVTSFLLIRNGQVKQKNRAALKKLMLFFADVDLVDLNTVRWSQIRFTRASRPYQVLISICQLLAQGMLMTTDAGDQKLMSFIRDQAMDRLYEKFILEYYRRHWPTLSPKASQIAWALDEGERTLLPIMQSDITLTGVDSVLIIDAKYYGKNTQENFDKHTVRSANLYQIFAYVKNKATAEPDRSVAGMLLYARTEHAVQPEATWRLDGHDISATTLDMRKQFAVISGQLDDIAHALTHADARVPLLSLAT